MLGMEACSNQGHRHSQITNSFEEIRPLAISTQKLLIANLEYLNRNQADNFCFPNVLYPGDDGAGIAREAEWRVGIMAKLS
jgi:hypothetical protein